MPARKAERKAKIFTVSVPPHLNDFLEAYMARYKMKRSHVVAEALRRIKQKEDAKNESR